MPKASKRQCFILLLLALCFGFKDYCQETFYNPNNYVAAPAGELPVLDVSYRQRLLKDDPELRLFMLCGAQDFMREHFTKNYLADFRKKFGEITPERRERITAMLLASIENEKMPPLKAAVADQKKLNWYFKLKLNSVFERQQL
jgi:hypothetical protein